MWAEDDLADFFGVDDFAVEATYTPAGGDPVTVQGIFDAPQATRNASNLLDVTIPSPQFVCPTADVMGVSEGDALEVSGTDYTIRVVLTDGTGVTTLVLERD